MVFELTIKDKILLINEANILYVQLGDGSVPQNEALTVDIVMINDKHITITSGKKAEAKEIYEKIKKRLFLDNLKIWLGEFFSIRKNRKPTMVSHRGPFL